MDKLKMHSPNFAEGNIAKLEAMFPNCVTESKDENGNLKKSIDFDLLKQELSTHIVDGPQERYQLNWPGKREALLTANAPIAKTLRPCHEESIDFDTTENLFIEGDNLDALKLLLENYLGKVKMIYIDPPYNKGKDFIYADNFAESIDNYLLESGQKDEEGNRLVPNPDSNGRFHSDWLSMMYSRLKMARNLLKEDGVIFISIDESEVHNLVKICEEIFGGKSVEQYIWDVREDGTMPKTAKKTVRKEHEYIIAAFKQETLKRFSKYSSFKYIDNNEWSNADNDPRGPWMSANISRGAGKGTGGSKSYVITNPAGISFDRNWSVTEDEFYELLNDQRIFFADDGKGVPRKKIFQNEPVESVQSSLFEKLKSSQSASSYLQNLLGDIDFDYPKPVDLLDRIIQISTKSDDIILDFFAGTSTTAHATMSVNAKDNGKRKFIMVQLDEKCDEKSNAFKLGYKTIAEISKERIRRAGKKIKEENPEKTKNLDIGFRVLKVDSSNMEDVYYTPDDTKQTVLFNNTDNIKKDRTSEDLLFQVLLDWGVDLTLPISKEVILDREVYFVDGNALAACFVKDGGISEDFCKELAKREPLRVVFRDSGFADDSVKINVEQIFKLMSPHTDVKTI
ncbi:adenine-specific DNA-methyltransferase [Methanohalophilus levihalophilus]|uniref:site-specific DNA-methyltransferase n=1 Tax=Methanohalophilus levihalophilus TaxID=1431282 RepID=UPI001AE3AADF|nr:site-specific DNA-methyltransferase [Methanohalophilus levihalophilus]MBP2030321.1 adenine-specific DNA-methyltransferase [Methanohalophilus levihalophilus]